jgi:hypothetical protein
MIASVADLVAFLKPFHRHWLDDPSLDPARIPSDLPDGLALIYRELGALVEIDQERSPFHAQDHLTPLSRLRRVDGMIEFAWENQGCWSARCPAGQSDPPVYSDAGGAWQDGQQGFAVICESLSYFLITLCLQEAVMSCRNLVSTDDDFPRPDQFLTVPLRPLWLKGFYSHGEPDHRFFVSSDEDVLVMDWYGLWVGSPTRKVAELVAPDIRAMELH